MTDAGTIIERLGLARHPEGGWYRETWRDAGPGGERGRATAILFLLEPGARSHWHRIDATELWLFHAGAPLLLRIAEPDVPERAIRLGADIAAGDAPQAIVPRRAWQAAETESGWSLVACVVAPAFDFAHFELAPPAWRP